MIMRTTSLHIALTFVLMCIAQLVWGQNELPYPIDTINGKAYYRYNVERSVGLYRISVNFGVKQEEILQANPMLQKRGLRYGEEILVPVKASADSKKNTEPIVREIEPVVEVQAQTTPRETNRREDDAQTYLAEGTSGMG